MTDVVWFARQMQESVPMHWKTLVPADRVAVVAMMEAQQEEELQEQAEVR